MLRIKAQLQQQGGRRIRLDHQGLLMGQNLWRPDQRAAAAAAFARLLRAEAAAFRAEDALHPCSTGTAHLSLNRDLSETGKTGLRLRMFPRRIGGRKHQHGAAAAF